MSDSETVESLRARVEELEKLLSSFTASQHADLKTAMIETIRTEAKQKIDTLTTQLQACEKKVAKYEDRLGLVYAYEGRDMTRFELSEKQKETFPDTVTCLECDVELRDDHIKDLETELTALQQQLQAMTQERDEYKDAFAKRSSLTELHQQLQARDETILKLRQDDLGKCTSYLWDEISALFPKLGVESAYVTDLSTVGDFPENGGMDEKKPLWQAAIDEQRARINELTERIEAYELGSRGFP